MDGWPRTVAVLLLLVAAACGSNDSAQPAATDLPSSSKAPATTEPATTEPATTVPATTATPPSVGSSNEPSSGPLCNGDLVPALAALDPATGEFQWTYCSADLAWREVRGATEGIVYIDSTMPDPSASASAWGQLTAVVAVDARSGEELWQVPVVRQPFGWPLGPFAGSGVVVVAVDDDNGEAIVGLDAKSGDTIWRVAQADLGDATASKGTPDPVVAPLANTDEIAVLAVPSGLVGLDRVSGTQLWSSEVSLLDESGVGAARGAAAVDGSTVMIPAASEVITGVVTDGGVIVSGPNVPSGETVTIPVGPSTLIAVDGSTGATLWKGPRLDHPAAADRYVVGYVHAGMGSYGPNSEVVVVDATTGEQLWSKPGSESYGDLWAIGDGAVYVNAINDNSPPDVVAYDLESGDERWRRTTESMPKDPQQVVDDGVVLLWNDLAVLSTTDGTTRWTIPASVSPETPMSSVGHNSASIFVSFNGRQWTD